MAALPVTSGGAAISFQSGPPKSTAPKTEQNLPADFSLPDGMKLLYGNYDAAKKSSTFRLSKKFPNTFFDRPGKVEAREFTAAGMMDSGEMKVFVLTSAVPAAAPQFNCHACAPVIGVAIFAKKGGAWAIEDADKSFEVMGNWGGPPAASIVRVGPDRAAFELNPGNTNQGETVGATVILLPWKGAIREAFNMETESTENSDCGDGTECTDKETEVSFVHGDNPDYDDLLLKITGKATSQKTGKEVEIHREQTWKFADGKYVRIRK